MTDTNNMPNGATQSGPVHSSNGPSLVREEPLFAPRKLKVICIGAGFSGLTLAYKWKHEYKMDAEDLTIFEKNSDVGGTWYSNRYPGVACDVPAPIYTFLFEPHPSWSHFYAGGKEIHEYIQNTTRKYGLDERIRFNRNVVETIWDENTARWNVKVQVGDTFEEHSADVLVNATGFLSRWSWPNIPGLHDFKGQLVHSADWNESIDWTGKRVALIGNGSSGIQMLPAMQKAAGHITTYIRNPTWVTPNFLSDKAGDDGRNFAFSEADKQKFRDDPAALHAYRVSLEHNLNGAFSRSRKDFKQRTEMREYVVSMMKGRMKSEALANRLIPDFGIGCRRVTPGDGYLEALEGDNVDVHFGGITRVTPSGIIDDAGNDRPFDIIVCATGFDVSWRPPWKVRGRDGFDVAEAWKDTPEAYLSMAVPKMPNYFMFFGPNTTVAHGVLHACMDFMAGYIMRWIVKITQEEIKTVEVKEDVTRAYNEYTQELLKKSVWSDDCRSWYKSGRNDGKVTAMYGGSSVHFETLLRNIRGEDFDIEYLGHPWRLLGNGFSMREHNGEHLAYYLES